MKKLLNISILLLLTLEFSFHMPATYAGVEDDLVKKIYVDLIDGNCYKIYPSHGSRWFVKGENDYALIQDEDPVWVCREYIDSIR